MKSKCRHIFNSTELEYFVFSLILIGSLVVRLYKINTPLADWHAWRQVDTASVTRTFKERGVDLLRPKYHDISSTQTGIFNPEGYRFVEFPVYNLLHLYFHKLVGWVSFETAGRIVSVCASLIASMMMYLIGKRLWGKVVGLMAAFYYGFLPYNIYFTRVVLPDPLAVCAALMGLYLFLEYYYKEKKWLLGVSAMMFSLAMLIKPFSIFFGMPVVYLALKKYGVRGIFKNYWLLIALDVALIPFFLWRGWMNNNPEYLKGVAHLKWAFNGDGIRFRPAFWRWIFGERLGKMILGIWGMVPFTFGLVGNKQGRNQKEEGPGFLYAMLMGMGMYVTIIATANVRHDYYQVFIIPAVALTLAWGSVAMWRGEWGRAIMSRGLLMFSIFLMMGISLYETRGFYAINHPEIVRAGKETSELIPGDALVIAPYNGDTTFLYQTGRWGWPVVNESIERMIERGADYYVSVNVGDCNTQDLVSRFRTVKETSEFVIVDLHEPK